MKKRNRRKVLRRSHPKAPSRSMRLERLEDRQLLATFTLAGVQPNTGEVLIRPTIPSDLVVNPNTGNVTVTVGSTLEVSPRELIFRFDQTARINPATLGAIHITGAGRDGVFDSGDDVIVSPGFIGVPTTAGDLIGLGQQIPAGASTLNEVVYRFAETLPDDLYRIEVFAQPDASAIPPVVTPIRGINPDPLAPPDTLAPRFGNFPLNVVGDAQSREILVFDLDTGPQVLAVVPQPVRRDANSVLKQARNQIEVYFSDDDLFVEDDAMGNPTPRSAEHPDFYQLILTRESIDNNDDQVFKPTRVDYDPDTDRAILTFGNVTDIHLLGGVPTGQPKTFRLRIGTREVQAEQSNPRFPLEVSPGADPGDSFATSNDLSTLTNESVIISSAIDPQPFLFDFLGSEDELGHRDVPDSLGEGFSQHINPNFGLNGSDNSPGITTIFYNFRSDYAPGLQNLITESQKARAREAFQLWSNYLGVQFLETPDLGLTIVNGDPNALPLSGPDIFNHVGNFNFIARVDPTFDNGMLILSNAFQWNDSFGSDFFQRTMIGIGAMLGLGRADDLPNSTMMAFNSPYIWQGAPVAEPIFPGNFDILHGQHLHRTDSNDIDLYRFEVDLQDQLLAEKKVALFTAETFAERLPNASLLDTVLRIYREVDGVASVATSFNTAGAVSVKFTARTAGPSGDQISIVVTKDPLQSAPPQVSVGGTTITIEMNTLNGRVTTAQQVVDAINNHAVARNLVLATIEAGSPDTNISAPAINYSPLQLRGGIVREQIARNDNYFSDDSYLELELGSGVYYIGVSASGNEQYDPTIAGTGLGGASQGEYDLRLTLRPDVDANDIIRDLDRSFTVDPLNPNNPEDPPETPPFLDLPGTRIDGDADGVPGGVHNFWFQTQQLSADPLAPRTLFVDKTPKAGPRDGSLDRPYQTIPEAFLNAKPGDIVRIVGNGGVDGLLETEADNFAYEVGINTLSQTLSDGSTMSVPKGVTVMIDRAAVFKMRRSRIGVGSTSLGATNDRSGGALQVLGAPRLISDSVTSSGGVTQIVPGQLIVTGSTVEPGSVFFTSWLDETIGRDTFAPTTTPARGDWGGIAMRADIDNAEARFNLEREGIFLNIVNEADIRYGGGGNVVIDGIQQVVNPIQITEMRPTITNNSITRSADAAMAADPNSFAETNFHSPQQQLGASFTSDYSRIGPEIHGNRLVNNSVNALFVKINTPAGSALPPLRVSGRFDDTNVVHYIAENLDIQSSPGDPILEVARPSASLVTLLAQPGGSLAAGVYNYKIVFVDQNGFEGRPSEATQNVTLAGANRTVQLSNLPSVSGNFQTRRIYRSSPGGVGPYFLAGELNATQSTFVDTGARTGPVLERDVPSTLNTTLTPQAGGFLAVNGTYNYRVTFVDAAGNEGPASDPTADLTLGQDAMMMNEQTIQLNNLPVAPAGFTKRIYRSQANGAGPYELAHAAPLAAGAASFTDNGAFTGAELDPLLLGVVRPRLNARLRIDPTLVVKLEGARIEARFGSQFIAEGLVGQEVVLTSELDDRFGAGGTFDTNDDDGPNEAQPRPGDWGGLFFGHLGTADIDRAVIAYGGGTSRIEGTFAGFNVIEVHQAEIRIANSTIENNANGVSGQGPTDRFGRGFNLPATILVRGAQPIIVNNIIRHGFDFQRSGAAPTNTQPAITINVNALGPELLPDVGRSTGSLDRISRFDDNHGPLIRGNRLANNGLNGLVVRGDVLTTEGIWDDTDIVHILTGQFDNAVDNVGQTFASQYDLFGVRRRYDEVIIPDLHTLGGLRLESSPTESLVVKLWGAGDSFNKPNGLNEPFPRELFGAGFTATGRPLEIRDRIGGVLHVLGRPGFPVVLTSLRDDTVGAGLRPNGSPQTDTNNDGFNTAPVANDWRSIVLDQYSYDRNVEVILEQEPTTATAPGANANIDTGQDIGDLAPHEYAGDENLRLGFVIHGYSSGRNDVDVYTFTAEGGTEVWLDIDRTTFALDAVVEVIDSNGNLLAQSNNSFDESQNPSLLFQSPSVPAGHVNRLQKRPDIYQPTHASGELKDFYSVNPRDAGMRIKLPGSPGSRSPYHVRVRSSNLQPGDLPTNQQDPARLTDGQTSGVYQLQIRMRETDEFAGSTVRYADIRYAMNGVEAYGLPGHSPLVGEFGEDESAALEPRESFGIPNGPDENNNNLFPSLSAPGQRPQELGNLFEIDQSVFSIAGALSAFSDVDYYAFDIDYTLTAGQFAEAFSSLVFDMDYADGLARPDTSLWVFTDTGQLLLAGLNSNVAEDQPGPLQGQDMDDFTRGSAGTRDPFIGAAVFPEGRYVVAVTSTARQANALVQPQTRREPINTVRRIAEDHIASMFFSTSQPPVVTDLFNEAALPAPWQVTMNRGNDAGHGVTSPFDGSRVAQPGGSSLFASSPGLLTSNTFDLSGYSADDVPVLYFTYFSDVGAGRLDLRINGQIVATTGAAAPPAVSLQDNVGWRQARVPLDQVAGLSNLALEFQLTGPLGPGAEGIYLDDFIIGFAERGELITGAAGGGVDLEIEPNNSLAGAQNLNFAGWSQGFSFNIGDATQNTSTTIPHASILAGGDDTFDYYSFTVPVAASRGIFDIDGADTFGGGFNAQMFLFDAAGNLLASNDDSPNSVGAGGSFSPMGLDPFFEFTFANPGTYVVAVAASGTTAGAGGVLTGNPVPTGATYTLHVSIQNRPLSSPSLFASTGVTSGVQDGEYQLEIRTASEFGTVHPFFGFPRSALTRTIDTNDRLTEEATIIAPDGSQLQDGDRLLLSDGVDSVTLEFNSIGGVTAGNLAVPFTAGDPAHLIARRIRDAINSPSAQTRFKLLAANADGTVTGTASRDIRVNLFGDAMVNYTLANVPSANTTLVVHHTGFGDENHFRHQGQLLIHSNTITDARDFGILVDAGERDHEAGVDVGFLGSHPGAVRNLRELNNQPVGGFAPGAFVANNAIAGEGLGGIHVSGDVRTWELTTIRPATFNLPFNDPNFQSQTVANSTAGDQVCDGWTFEVHANRQTITFEWEDISGSPGGCGSAALGGNGYTDGNIPVFYRRTGPAPYLNRTLGYNQNEMAIALRAAFNSSTLITNGTSLTAEAIIEGSRSIANARNGFADPAVYLENVDHVGPQFGGVSVWSRMVLMAQAPQPFVRVVNNTVFGNDGDDALFAGAPIDEPNDTIHNAVDTKQGRQHYPLSYVGQGTIGDGINFPADLARDVDFYQFHLQVGERVTVDVAATMNSNLDTFLRLFDEQGRELAVNDNTGTGTDSSINFVATSAGTYYAAVSAAGNENYDSLALGNRTTPLTSGDYTIDLNVRAPRTFVFSAVDGNRGGLVGSTFQVEDVTGNIVTFEFVAAGGAPQAGNEPIFINDTAVPAGGSHGPGYGPGEVAVAIANAINAVGQRPRPISPLQPPTLNNRYGAGLPNLVGDPPVDSSLIDTRTANPLVPLANPLTRVTATPLGGKFGAEKMVQTVHRRPISGSPFPPFDDALSRDFFSGGEEFLNHNTRAGDNSTAGSELHVVIENAARISTTSPLLLSLITPNPGSNADQIIPETGVLVTENATPTLLNNLLINLQAGLMDETPVTTTVIGASVFQNNGNPAAGGILTYMGSGDSNVGNLNDDFNEQLNASQRVFVNAPDNDFTPAPQSWVIDSSDNSSEERQEFASIKGAVGIPPSPILAPDRDVNGILRVDDPDFSSPIAATGGNVFKDRGAADRADFVGPAADLVLPQDNDPAGNDSDPARSVVQLTSGVFPAFVIQLTDAFELADPFPGIGVDDATVQHTVIENGLQVHPGVTLFENGIPLRENIDYSFSYDSTSNAITLTPLPGLWLAGRVYTVRLNNEDRFVITVPSGDAFADGDQVTITDATGASVVFEFESGYVMQIPEPLLIQTPTPAPALDGRTFSINAIMGGALVARFEFDIDGVFTDANNDSIPDNILIPINLATDTRDTLADKIVAALAGASIGVPQKLPSGDVFVGLPFSQQLISTITGFTRGQHPIINDGELFTISGGVGGPVTFEFDTDGQLTDANMDMIPDNVPIMLTGADTRDDVADKIVAAITGEGLNLDPDPTDTFAVPRNLGNGRIQIGGLPGHVLDTSQAGSLLVTGAPGVEPGTTLQMPGPLAIVVPPGGGGAITDGNTFSITVGAQTTSFEFDSDGVSTGNVVITYTGAETQDMIANAMAAAIATAFPVLSPVNLGNGVVELGAPRGTTLDLSLAPALMQQGGFVNDGEVLTIFDGVNPPVVFEFDDNNMFVAGNRPINILSANTVDALVNAIISAINTAISDSVLVGLSPVNLGGGLLQLNDTNRHITILSPGSSIVRLGVPGGAVPVVFVPGADFGPDDVADALDEAIQQALSQGMFIDVDLSLRFGPTYFLDGVLGVSGLPNFFLPAIADEAGNPLKANTATDETLFTIIMPGVRRDFGDAPQDGANFNYPTRFADDGAWHVIANNNPLLLGSRVDGDPDGQPGIGALGDDNEFNVIPMTSGMTVSTIAGLGWQLQLPANYNLATADGRRFRITEGGNNFIFELNDDDNFVDVDMDLVPDNILVDIRGVTTVAEVADAIAAAIASVADLDLPAFHQGGGTIILPADDEDGVVFLTALNAFVDTQVEVTVSRDGMLDAWIDFNDDGDWDDPQEKVEWISVNGQTLPPGAVSVEVTQGVNLLTFRTPISAATNVDFTTYARFRVSTSGDLMPGGMALDGEVEDYEVTVRRGMPPVANPQARTTQEDVPITNGQVSGSDPDGDPITFMVVSQPANGTVVMNPNGSFTYTPDLNFNGVDTFTFKAFDGQLNSIPATVTITVTPLPDAPIATSATYMPTEDQPFVGQAQGNDPDGDPITFMLVTGPTSGQLTFNTDGTFTYQPDPDFDGVDSFTFMVNDGNSDSNVATATLDVQGINDPPVATSASFTTNEDVPLTEPAPVTDVDGDVLTFMLLNPPSNGTVMFNGDGTFTYTPTQDFFGPDTFTFRANDGTVNSNIGSVTITVQPVNDPPDAMDDPTNPGPSFTTTEDQMIARNFSINLFNNDTDPDGDALSLDSFQATSGEGAAVVVFADGTFQYDPRNSPQLQQLTPGDFVDDTFTYTVTDGNGGFDTATVTIRVNGANDLPTAVNDPSVTNPFPAQFTTNEDTVLTLNGSLLLANDFDPEGAGALEINGVSIISNAGAAVSFNVQTGVVTYNPQGSSVLQALGAGDSFDDTFTYTIRDGNDVSLPATVTIRVNGLNDAPTANADAATTETAVSTTINVLANDTDPDSAIDATTVQIVSNPTNGSVTVNSLTGVVTYRSNSNFSGVDTFTYRVADADGAFSTPATVTVTVNQRLHPWRNPSNSLDVNNDGAVTILDAILVVGVLRNFGVDVDLTDSNLQTMPGFPQPNIVPFVDTFDNPNDPNDDDRASLQDLLAIINFLRSNLPGGGEAEGEGESQSEPPAPLVQATSVFDAGAVDGSFPGYRALTDITSQSYFRRLQEREQGAAVVAAVGELAGDDAIAVSEDDDSYGALESSDDSLHATALDALFSEGFEP